jgi:hypothetical protein
MIEKAGKVIIDGDLPPHITGFTFNSAGMPNAYLEALVWAQQKIHDAIAMSLSSESKSERNNEKNCCC